MYISDTLSRAALRDTTPEIADDELNGYIHSVVATLPISDTRLKEFQLETSTDETLQNLIKQIRSGWPENRNLIHPDIRAFYNYRDELSIYHDLVLKGQRIIVPKKIQKKMLFHESDSDSNSSLVHDTVPPTVNAPIYDDTDAEYETVTENEIESDSDATIAYEEIPPRRTQYGRAVRRPE